MFCHSAYIFHTTKILRGRDSRRRYVVIAAILIALVAIPLFTDAVFLQFMWIDHRNDEGGPLGYLTSNSSIWWMTFGTVASQTANFIADGVLVRISR
jgi:hypothetical protein